MVSLADQVPASAGRKTCLKPDRAEKSRQDALYDSDLVNRFNGGDQNAFTEIVARHRARVYSVGFSMLRNHGDAEEIAQDVFVRAHRSLATFRGESSLATWLHHVALNLSRNRYWYFHRRFRHATVSLDPAVSEDNTSSPLDLLACDAAGPTQAAVTHEFVELIARCMKRLDERQRAILTLSHTHAYGEIAKVLGINIGTVKSRIARARDNLRALLSQACPEFGSLARPLEWLEPARGHEGLKIGQC